MIDGLRLTMSGEELHRRLEARANEHLRRSYRWRCEESRALDEQTEEAPLLPEQMCGNEAERHAWRAAVLSFIRDHIDAAESYRLTDSDLAFAELLPEMPEWMQQEEYEGRFTC